MALFVSLTCVFGVSLCVSLALTPLLRRLALKEGFVAPSGARHVHTAPVPYLGGVAIYAAFIAGIILASYYAPGRIEEPYRVIRGLIIASTLIVSLGLWDDIKKVPPLVKLSGQVIAALILFWFGFRAQVLTNPFLGVEMQVPFIVSLCVTTLWFVGLMNAMNLIDGLDGLAAGITVIVCLSLILVSLYLKNYFNALLLVAIAASALGFLRFNFFPAKIFMGDAGSMLLGLAIGAVALIGSQNKSATAVVLLPPFTALALPVFDTFIAIIRRISKQKQIFRADRKHLHHRLLDMGLKHKVIVLFLYLITLYLGVFAFLFVLIPDAYALILLFLLALGLFMGIQVITFVESRLEHAHQVDLRRRRMIIKLRGKPRKGNQS